MNSTFGPIQITQIVLKKSLLYYIGAFYIDFILICGGSIHKSLHQYYMLNASVVFRPSARILKPQKLQKLCLNVPLFSYFFLRFKETVWSQLIYLEYLRNIVNTWERKQKILAVLVILWMRRKSFFDDPWCLIQPCNPVCAWTFPWFLRF